MGSPSCLAYRYLYWTGISHGNSLVGVGQLSELEDKVNEKAHTLCTSAKDFVGDASEALSKLGRLADATQTEVQQARKAWADADAATKPAKALCDILSASRIEMKPCHSILQCGKRHCSWRQSAQERSKVLDGMNIHFPVVFPEVFLREDQI